jgi:4-amino-4-deoxy-L-arabinose transferase-like glycosyltransferase
MRGGRVDTPAATIMKTSDATREPAQRWRFLTACALGLLLLTVATRLPLLGVERPIDDEVVYAVVGQTIVDGGMPYVNAVERKPPLLFYVYAAALRLFGHDNWRALHGVETAWILATMAGLYFAGRRMFDDDAGLTAALLYSIFQAWSYWNNLAFNGEVLMNLPIAWAYALAFSRARSRRFMHLFLAGGLIAVGFLLKQPAAIALVPLAILVLLPSYRQSGPFTFTHSIGQLLSLGLGFGMVLSAAAIWLWSRGLFGDAFYWTITDHAVPEFFWIKGLENTLAFTAFCVPLTAGAWVSWRDHKLWAGRRPQRLTLTLLVIVSLVGAGSSGRFYPHYYIAVIPPCALLAAPWLAQAWRAAGRERRVARLTQAWLAATVIVFAVAHGRGLSRQPAVSEAGQYLMTHSSADDRIFVWGQATRIYVDAHRRPASRFIATFPLTGLIFGAPLPAAGEQAIDTRSRIVPGSWDKLREDFAAHQPAFIVDTETAKDARYPIHQFPALEQLLFREYEPVAETADGIVYKRDLAKQDPLTAESVSSVSVHEASSTILKPSS